MCTRQDTIRQRARSLAKQIGVPLMIRAQEGLCPCCMEQIEKDQPVSVDHVHSIHSNPDDDDPNPGNILIVHVACNGAKGNAAPTNNELSFLAMVNNRLAFNEATGSYGVTMFAIETVNKRKHSLQTRRDQLAIHADNKGERLNATLQFGMYTVEIEALEVMIKQYDEIVNG